MEITTLFTDGLFACMAAIGFGSINNTPRSLLPWCGLIAAIGHATRFAMMNSSFHINIIPNYGLAGIYLTTFTFILRLYILDFFMAFSFSF